MAARSGGSGAKRSAFGAVAFMEPRTITAKNETCQVVQVALRRRRLWSGGAARMLEGVKTKHELTAPRAAVGVLVVRGDEVLLVLRRNAPAKGLWAVPGGSIVLGESLQRAAEREVREETGV